MWSAARWTDEWTTGSSCETIRCFVIRSNAPRCDEALVASRLYIEYHYKKMKINDCFVATMALAFVFVVDCRSQVLAPTSLPPCLIQYSSSYEVFQSDTRVVLYNSDQTFSVIRNVLVNNETTTTAAPTSGTFTYTVDPQDSAHATITYGGNPLSTDELYFTAAESGSQSPPNQSVPGGLYANFTLYPKQITNGACNVSSRVDLAAGGIGISGFVVKSGGPRWALVRAVGATLGKMGLSSGVSSPSFTLYDSTQTVAGTSATWSSDPNLVSGYETVFSLLGAFPLEIGSDEGVLLVPLNPGAYTAVFKAGSPGTILCEVYILPF